MALELLSPIDFNSIPAQEFRPYVGTSAPSSPTVGMMWYDSTNNLLKFWNGSAWTNASAPPVDANSLEYNSGTLRLSAAAAGGGLTGGAGAVLAVGAGTGITVNANDVAVDTATIATVAALNAAIEGFAQKDDVRAVATSNVTISTGLNAGDVVDGVTLANGDRVLLTAQTASAENGIYVVSASPARAPDMSTSAEATAARVWASDEGTSNKNTVWTTDFNGNTDTLGTTAMTWTQQPSVNDIVAGAGLTKSGNTLDVGAGTGIVANANDVAIDTSVVARKGVSNIFVSTQFIDDAPGGSGTEWLRLYNSFNSAQVRFKEDGTKGLSLETTQTGSKITLLPWDDLKLSPGSGQVDFNNTKAINMGDATAAAHGMNRQSSDARYPKKYVTDIGNGSSTSLTVTHNLGTRDVLVMVRDNTSYAWKLVQWDATTTNTVTIGPLDSAPASNALRVMVVAL